jgi:tight adherence protein B
MNFLIVPFILIFIITICIIECVRLLGRKKSLNRNVIRSKIQKFSAVDSGSEPSDILRKKVLSDIEFFNDILWKLPGIQQLDRMIQQANLGYPLGFFILLSLVFLVIGYYTTSLMTRNYIVSLVSAIVLSAVPYVYIRMKKKERMNKFEQQLPEGMEFLSRALRAGHAFTGAMKLAAENFDDPLGTEFDKTLDEINFGISTNEALKNLLNRVDSPDLRYFTVSVILQRETGGNLGEIMDSIARIIRERFKFRDKVRVLSAEGRLSAAILIAIPVLLIVYLNLVRPEYLKILTTEPTGKIVVAVSISMVLLGITVIRRLININI